MLQLASDQAERPTQENSRRIVDPNMAREKMDFNESDDRLHGLTMKPARYKRT